jgi:hypothetical protein
MRLRNFLHPNQLLPYFILFAVAVTAQSCGSSKEIRASIDGANEVEGGASGLDNQFEMSYNIGVCFLLGMPGVHSNAAADGSLKGNVDPWALSGQLEFIQKGSKLGDSKTSLNYLNAIGDVLYQYPLQDKGVLYGGLGPYIGYGLGGHVKAGDTKEPVFGSDGYKRLDAGIHLTAGYRLSMGLSLNLGYEYGLLNKSRFDDFTSKNRAYYFQIGYSLDKIIGAFKK